MSTMAIALQLSNIKVILHHHTRLYSVTKTLCPNAPQQGHVSGAILYFIFSFYTSPSLGALYLVFFSLSVVEKSTSEFAGQLIKKQGKPAFPAEPAS